MTDKKVRTGGAASILREQIDQNEIEAEKRYDRYGMYGLVLPVAGTALQIAANLV